jgi:hypothetical protein
MTRFWNNLYQVRSKSAYLCFYYYHWGDTSAGGLLAFEGIIRPVVGAY